MNTVLVNTTGGSKFASSDDIISEKAGFAKALFSLFGMENAVQITNTDGYPILKPNRQVIDVVNDFSWYAGPKSTPEALAKVPCVFMVEKQQELSSLISGAMYYLNAAKTFGQQLTNSAYIKSALAKLQTGDGGNAYGAYTRFFGQLDSMLKTDSGDFERLKAHNLKSLQGIYLTSDTGFKYRMPMYSQNKSQTNTFGEGQDSMLAGIVNKGRDMANEIAYAINIAQPGVYIEQPKYFKGAEEGPSHTVEIPLSNTIKRGTVSPIQQNYELIWLLTFQNKPYKTSFARTPPPKIYEVSCPGQFSFPYAYISNMSVDFQGTIRNTKVAVPTGNGEGVIGKTIINTPVPEAYSLKITFTSLIGDYGNTMISDAFGTTINDNTVTFGKQG